MANRQLRINADNSVTYDQMKDASTGSFINAGVTCTFTVLRKRAEDGVMESGSATLESAAATFSAGDVGRTIVVHGAGVDGSDLRTTIQSFTSSTEVVLASSASTDVSAAIFETSLTDAQNVAMAYVSSSDGQYRGTLNDSVSLATGMDYIVEITVDAGSGRKDFRRFEDVVAQYGNDT